MKRTQGQHRRQDWRDGFLFVGNNLLLDFLNTRPFQGGGPQELLPDFAALARWFRAAGVLRPNQVKCLLKEWNASAAARRIVAEMHALREELRQTVMTWESGGTLSSGMIRRLNGLLAAHPMIPRMEATPEGLRMESSFVVRRPEDLFAPVAHSAAMLFTEADRSRVRKCNNCVLHFVDTSKKGTRRWCSMRLCGNRLKVAAFTERRRSVAGHEPT